MQRIVLFILVLFAAFNAFAQNSQKVKELKEQREKAMAEVQAVNQLLSENKKTTSTALNRLNLLVKQINNRRELIRLLNQEIDEVDQGIQGMELNIKSLEKDLNSKKDAYAKSLRKMYLNQSNEDELLFIFSADNFTQSYRRILYLKEYAKWERRQAEEIMAKQKRITDEKEKLLQRKEEKTALLGDRQQEEKQLEGEEGSQKQEVQSLKTEQKQLETDLNKKKKQAQALNQAIEKAIADEIARAEKEKEREREKEKVAEKEKTKEREKEKTPSATTSTKNVPAKVTEERVAETKGGYAMTKEEKVLSDNFVNNKGQLPFPVRGKYVIVSGSGTHNPEGLKYVSVNNNGIDVQTAPGADARCVFKGIVSKIFVLPGFNNNIIVRHGNYLTVYSNIEKVAVKQGDVVSTGQVLGKIFTDSENGNETILHFELWKERDKLNPQSWLSND